MLHHLSFAVTDLERSARFYDAALSPLGYGRVWSNDTAVGYGLPGGGDKFAIRLRPENGAVPGDGFHVAFAAPDRDAVNRFYEAALGSGGRDNGPAGLCPEYGEHYYAAFVIDPDGYPASKQSSTLRPDWPGDRSLEHFALMSIETSMADYYAGRAREYERIYEKPERQADLQRLRETVEAHFAGTDVFEVACGTGYWTEVLARSAASVLATDFNEEVLTVARGKAMDAQTVEFRREDAYALPATPRKFTAGFSGFWWSHVAKARIRGFLRGFHRVLSPGAKVMWIDNVYVEGSSTPIARTDANGDTYQLRRLDDGSTHEVLKNFPTAAELSSSVEGLAANVRVEFLEYYWMLSYTARAEAVRGAGP